MRRVNIRHGLKQRINEILGTDYTGGGQSSPPGITDWSIQAAVIENLRRIVSGIAGNVKGAPMNGLLLGGVVGSSTFTLSKGFGFTNNGDIVVVGIDLSGLSLPSASEAYVYAKHSLAYLDDDGSTPGAKETGFIGQSGEANIVIDDLGATLGTSLTEGDDVIIVETSELTGTDLEDHVYIGKIDISGGNITAITQRGLTLNDLETVHNLTVGGTITALNVTVTDTIALEDLGFDGTLTANSGSTLKMDTGSKADIESTSEVEFKSGSTLNINASATVEVGGSAVHNADITLSAITVIHVKNGLITGVT